MIQFKLQLWDEVWLVQQLGGCEHTAHGTCTALHGSVWHFIVPVVNGDFLIATSNPRPAMNMISSALPFTKWSSPVSNYSVNVIYYKKSARYNLLSLT